MANWHYVGNYGQTGPITDDQLKELIDVGGITANTLVWNPSMPDWKMAGQVDELRPHFGSSAPSLGVPPLTPPAMSPTPFAHRPPAYPVAPLPSPKSRVAAGVLNIVFPGVGRLYAGYITIGVLQLVLAFASFGVLALWSTIDGVMILVGSVPNDGEGRPFTT